MNTERMLPEIHEKLDPKSSRGLLAFFTREPIEVVYCTQVLEKDAVVYGLDEWSRLEDGRLKVRVSLKQDEAQAVFLDA